VASDSPTLRVGIVGLGQATVSFLPSLLTHPHVQITAGADPRPEPRGAFARDFEAEVYENGVDLCASADVDAVYVALPEYLHAEHVIAAAEHGKHAIVEKPMALTLEECDAMLAAVDRAGTHLVVGHSHGFDPPVFKMREIVRSGELGPLGLINSFCYKGFVYGLRRPDELDMRTGGLVHNHAAHQLDIVRWIGGGRVRSVRAMAGTWDPERPIDGVYAGFLDFEDGAVATVVQNGYGYFDADEFHYWIGEMGQPKAPDHYSHNRRSVTALSRDEEAARKAAIGYGGRRQRAIASDEGQQAPNHPHFGVTIVSCARGDMRASADGVYIYDEEGRREVPVPLAKAVKSNVVDELYQAVANDRTPPHDGRWGKATLEVCLALLESSAQRKEVMLSHQVPTPD